MIFVVRDHDFDERNLSYRSLKTKQELQKIDLKIIEGKNCFCMHFILLYIIVKVCEYLRGKKTSTHSNVRGIPILSRDETARVRLEYIA